MDSRQAPNAARNPRRITAAAAGSGIRIGGGGGGDTRDPGEDGEKPGSSVVDPDPHHFGNLDPHRDPHQHKIKIRIRLRIPIRIKVISWIRNRIRINLQMTSQIV